MFKYIIFSLFLLCSSCVAQPTVDHITSLPIPSHPDVLNQCTDKYTGEKLNYYKSHSTTIVLDDFFNVKALRIIDVYGVYRVVTELEIPNYECSITQVP